jgi:uncharacterized membrane protein
MLVEKYKKTTQNLLMIVTIIILSFSNMYIIYKDIQTVQKDTKNSYYYRLAQPELSAAVWLKDHTGTGDIILSNWFYGNLLPGFTGRTVYVGHKIQTTDFDRKIEMINTFLREKDTVKAKSFLADNHITYIYIGIADSLIAYGFEPDMKPFLTKVYDRDGVRIYKVQSAQTTKSDVMYEVSPQDATHRF